MSTCNGCGGIVGRDCFNPSECEWITHSQEQQRRYKQEQEISELRQRVAQLESALNGKGDA